MKPIKSLAATLGAAILLAGAPALASAAPTQVGPIHIDGVQLIEQAAAEDENYNRPDAVDISFTNSNRAPATDIVFALESNGAVIDQFNDVGSFAPGVRVNHRFASDALTMGNAQLAVAKVTFADGTVWSDPTLAAVAAPAPPQTVGVDVQPDSEY
jgi:hypothetical protein